MTAPLESAEQAVTDARQAPAFWLPVAQGLINGRAMDAALDAVVAAVETRYTARLREAASWTADACRLHPPTGVPCDCGHDGGADCHPRSAT